METMKGWVDTSTVRAYYDYKDHESHLWIATFQDGAKYAWGRGMTCR
jgi:hypothetical protein